MRKFFFLISFIPLIAFVGCFRQTTREGWTYNDPSNGGFEKVPFYEQETPPDMILVEGGILPIKNQDEEIADISCQSFYISKYEETNGQYLAYVNFLKKYYSQTTYKNALPDTTVWLGENLTDEKKEYLKNNYFRNPIYRDFPVVGVSTEQATNYAWWKTDRLNEFVLMREGILEDFEPTDSTQVFNTIAYLQGTYNPHDGTLPNLNPDSRRFGKRKTDWGEYSERIIRMEDGIVMPPYRLPSTDEWKFAALAVGDSEYRYLKTPAETPFHKYNRNGRFDYLKISVRKEKTPVSEFGSAVQKIGNVYDASSNNYEICGMSGGVSEMAMTDSLHTTVMGGSWREEENYAAVYYKTGLDSMNYRFPKAFRDPVLLDTKSSGVFGFRLAMSHITEYTDYHPGDRRKGK